MSRDKKHVLVLDDEERWRKELCRALTRYSGQYEFVVHPAATVEEAQAQMKETSFDVVLIDRRLGQPGDGALTMLNVHAPGVVHIVFTAYPEISDCVQAIKRGADDYLVKNHASWRDNLFRAIEEGLRDHAPSVVAPTSQWLQDNWEMLATKHSGQYVAYHDGAIIASNEGLRSLLEEIETDSRGRAAYVMMVPCQTGSAEASG